MFCQQLYVVFNHFLWFSRQLELLACITQSGLWNRFKSCFSKSYNIWETILVKKFNCIVKKKDWYKIMKSHNMYNTGLNNTFRTELAVITSTKLTSVFWSRSNVQSSWYVTASSRRQWCGATLVLWNSRVLAGVWHRPDSQHQLRHTHLRQRHWGRLEQLEHILSDGGGWRLCCEPHTHTTLVVDGLKGYTVATSSNLNHSQEHAEAEQYTAESCVVNKQIACGTLVFWWVLKEIPADSQI